MEGRLRTAGPWLAVVVLVLATVRCVVADPRTLIPGPYGGVDAVFQAGLLAWTARWWLHPAVWLVPPVFYPATDALWAMDTLLGQGILVSPLVALGATPAQLYDAAFLLSLLLAAVAAAYLWRASGGEAIGAGILALLVLAAPYTTSQLGHLNQLPPVLVLLAAVAAAYLWRASGGEAAGAGILALLVLAAPYTTSQLGHLNQLPPVLVLLATALFAGGLVRRSPRGLTAGLLAWAFQPLFGWYGLVQGGLLLGGLAVAGRRELRTALAGVPRGRVVAVLALALLVVGLLATPHSLARRRDPGLHAADARELRWYSADRQDLLRVGPYRARPVDWLGRGPRDPERSAGAVRRVVHPGWSVLLLGLVGLSRRRRLDPARRRVGDGLLLGGAVGLVFAFGDSVGLPGTAWRLPLPWGVLRGLFPPLEGYRAVCRFAWPLAVALAWWGTVAWTALVAAPSRRRRAAAAGIVLLVLGEGIPMGVPAVSLPAFPVRGTVAPDRGRPLLSLPFPPDEQHENRREALWWLAAEYLGRPVTGGVSGRVPAVADRLRRRAAAGLVDPESVRVVMRELGIDQAVTPRRTVADDDGWGERLAAAGWSAVDTADWRIWTPPVAPGEGNGGMAGDVGDTPR